MDFIGLIFLCVKLGCGVQKKLNPTAIKYASLQAVSEVGIGSLLHQWHVPLTGQILSLNQIVILTFLGRQPLKRRECADLLIVTSTLGAMLKVFSPMGKRLTPMLAILVQGLLYSLGILMLGRNILGVLVGSVLSSIWAYVQPLAIAWILMGDTFFVALAKVWSEIALKASIPESSGIWLLAAFVGTKVVLAMGLSGLVWWRGRESEDRYRSLVQRIEDRKPGGLKPAGATENVWRLAFRDFLRPMFLAPAIMSLVFFYYSGEPSDLSLFIYSVRVLVGGYFIFFLLRSFQGETLLKWLKRSTHLGEAFEEVFKNRSRVSKS